MGRVSTTGVVPACASLDCLTCFAATVRDAATVVQIMQVTKVAGVLCDRVCDSVRHVATCNCRTNAACYMLDATAYRHMQDNTAC